MAEIQQPVMCGRAEARLVSPLGTGLLLFLRRGRKNSRGAPTPHRQGLSQPAGTAHLRVVVLTSFPKTLIPEKYPPSSL